MSDVPGDMDLLRPWLDIVRRLRQVAVPNGPAVITMTIVVGEGGAPLPLWMTPQVRCLEPRRKAEDTLNELLSGLTSDS